MKVLEMLGIYGWKTETEHAVLASRLRGHTLVSVGKRACADGASRK